MYTQNDQLNLFEKPPLALDASLWHGSFNGRESTLQQLSPYVGKLKSGMVQVLLELYSQPGNIVLDPFCGSGVVPLEAALSGRVAWGNDLSPYAYAITRGKLETPPTETQAIAQAHQLLNAVDREKQSVDSAIAPEWVREFFHPETFKEVLAAFRLLQHQDNYFLLACLMGILHHVRPGFLSYPASHLVPYLRKKNIPPKNFQRCMGIATCDRG